MPTIYSEGYSAIWEMWDHTEGEALLNYLAEEKFQPPLFHKVYDQGGARIYAYSPQEST